MEPTIFLAALACGVIYGCWVDLRKSESPAPSETRVSKFQNDPDQNSYQTEVDCRQNEHVVAVTGRETFGLVATSISHQQKKTSLSVLDQETSQMEAYCLRKRPDTEITAKKTSGPAATSIPVQQNKTSLNELNQKASQVEAYWPNKPAVEITRRETFKPVETSSYEQRKLKLLSDLDQKISKLERDYRRKKIVAGITAGGTLGSSLVDAALICVLIPPLVTSSLGAANVAQWTDLRDTANRLKALREERRALLQ